MNIKISERDFQTYLNLYKFPIDLEEALTIKHQKLQDEQIRISAKIRDHVRDTKCIIKAFRSRYKKFQDVGWATNGWRSERASTEWITLVSIPEFGSR